MNYSYDLIKTIHLIHVKFFRNLAAGRIKRRRTIMSCIEYESVEIEDSTSEKEGKARRVEALPCRAARRSGRPGRLPRR